MWARSIASRQSNYFKLQNSFRASKHYSTFTFREIVPLAESVEYKNNIDTSSLSPQASRLFSQLQECKNASEMFQ